MFANVFTVAELDEIDDALRAYDVSSISPIRLKIAALIAALEPPSPSELARMQRVRQSQRDYAEFLDSLLHTPERPRRGFALNDPPPTGGSHGQQQP